MGSGPNSHSAGQDEGGVYNVIIIPRPPDLRMGFGPELRVRDVTYISQGGAKVGYRMLESFFARPARGRMCYGGHIELSMDFPRMGSDPDLHSAGQDEGGV